MPVNPPTQKLIDMIYNGRTKPINETTIEEYRESAKLFAKLAGKREPVYQIENKTLPGPHGDIPIRIYTPNNKIPHACLIYIKGSGFIFGELEGQDPVCRSLANAISCKVIAIQYRSAPEYKYPTGLEDTYTAVKWIIENVNQLKINRDKIALAGYSSGGNFAALITNKLRDEKVHLAYQILVAPVTDLTQSFSSHKEFAKGYILDGDYIQWCFNHYLPKGTDLKDPKLSPLFETTLKGLPPTLVITAEYDPLRDEGKAYADKLKEAGIPVIYSRYKGQIHQFLGCRGILQKEKNPIDEIAEVLKKAFKIL